MQTFQGFTKCPICGELFRLTLDEIVDIIDVTWGGPRIYRYCPCGCKFDSNETLFFKPIERLNGHNRRNS